MSRTSGTRAKAGVRPDTVSARTVSSPTRSPLNCGVHVFAPRANTKHRGRGLQYFAGVRTRQRPFPADGKGL